MPNKDKTEDYLSRLAEGVKTDPHFQSIQKWLGGRDIGEVFSPSAMGFTRQAAVDEAVKQFYSPNLTAQSRQLLHGALVDLLKVIRKTPKKAIQHIEEVKILPGSPTSGSYHPKILWVFPTEGGREGGTMASSFAHEAGHGASLRMAGSIAKRYQGIGSINKEPAERIGMDLYNVHRVKQDPFEGVAEYLGRYIQEQAGLIPKPYFGHGAGQQKVFEELSKMPSKNPYMNVYRYLQKQLSSL